MSTRAYAALAAALCSLLAPQPGGAAETTGAILGTVVADGKGAGSATVEAASPSGRYVVRTDDAGQFTFAAVAPDTYVLSVTKRGFAAAPVRGIGVVPGGRTHVTLTIAAAPSVIGTVTAAARSGPTFAQNADVFQVSGEAARGVAAASASGLATYARGTVQAAIASVPGVVQDPFANAIVRGGKVGDVVYRWDDVPVPQGLVAEPGGNVIGAQLATTGTASVSVATAGMAAGADNALSALIDQVPLTGTFPASGQLRFSMGLAPGARELAVEQRWATPNLSHRYAVAATAGSEAIRYGDGSTFYPAEAATYGLSLASRAAWSVAGTAHIATSPRDDLEVATLAGASAFDQYGTPFAGETYGAFDGAVTAYPREPSSSAVVTTPSRIRGTYAVQKVQVVRTFERGYARLRAYRSQYGAATDAPFFDDLSFPNGVVSYLGRQSSRLDGIGLDVTSFANPRHERSWGIELRRQTSSLDQLVPTLDQHIVSAPVLRSALIFAAERWSPSPALSVEGTLRGLATHVNRSDGTTFWANGIDPHLSVVYRRGSDALRGVFDRATVAPKPLEAERFTAGAANTQSPGPAPERGTAFELSYEHAAAVRLRATVFRTDDRDRIDVLPANARTTGLGVPQNVGRLLASGAELGVARGPLTFSATYVRAFSSSASQFSLNELNAAAAAAGHLFPAGYVPDVDAQLTYRVRAGPLTIAPTVSFESGYRYGNGRAVWVFDANGRPVQVPNDNHVNPGANYYFLRDAGKPFDALANPYVASIGTPEGADPNTLRSAPHLLASVHAEFPVSARITIALDVQNLFATSTPTQLQGNPYLVGPPGYRGGDPLTAAWYGAHAFGTPYVLGNGVPTNDGVTRAVPWDYGTSGYVPSSYPEARSLTLQARVRL